MNIPVDIAMRDLDAAKRSIQDVELTVKTLGDELDLFRSTMDDIETLPRFIYEPDGMERAKTGELTLDVYTCRDCGRFHVGKSRFRRAQ